MCAVSAVLDYGRKYEKLWWDNNNITLQTIPVSLGPSITWKEYAELLRKAAEFDKTTNQPDCHDPDKMEWLNKVLKRFEELGEEYKKLGDEIKEILNG